MLSWPLKHIKSVRTILTVGLWLGMFFYASAQKAHPEELIFSFVDSINTVLKNTNQISNDECSLSIYLRHNMYTHRNGSIVRFIPRMPRLERGTNEYVTEAQLQLQLRPPGEVDCKVVAFHSTARYLRPERFSAMGRFNFQIYQSKLFIDQLLNPFNRRNRKFYRYEYAFTHIGNDTLATTVRVNIHRRFNNEELAYGYADVDVKTGAVTNFLLHFNYQLQNITINARMGKQGYDQLVPQRMRIVSDFKLLGNRVFETTDLFAQHSFMCPVRINHKKKNRFDLTTLCALRIDTTQVNTSAEYFDSIRPMALRKAEEAQFKEHYNEVNDTISRFALPTDLAQTGFTPRKTFFNKKNTQNILLSSHRFNLTSNGNTSVKLPPLITPSMVQWSKTKGVSIKTNIHFSFSPRRKAQQELINFTPSIGYSFKQKQVYWNLPLLFHILPYYNGLLSFKAGGGSHYYNNHQANELRNQLKGHSNFDSLQSVINRYGFNDYLDTYASTQLSLSPHPGLTLTFGGCFSRRVLINWNKLAADAQLQHYISSIGPSVQLEWTPAQYYYRQGRRRLPLYSRYPTFIVNYERGLGLQGQSSQFEKVEGEVRYRLPLYALRTLYFRANAGVYTKRGKDCFIDYDFFRFNYLPHGWTDELTGEFQLLSARWYNESRYYIQCTSAYESPMMLLSRLPGISRVVQKERIYLNLLSVKALGLYAELGYGISTHLLDLGLFTGISHDKSLNFGCKVILKSP